MIGRGGMGRVYEAWDRRERRMVALKMIHESLANEPHVVHRFGNEVLALRSVDHPNVVAFLDTGLHF
ncbi:MAG: protein kinase, partial [Polyangiaceae bacterium]